jgi:hypothetical protein
MLELIINFHLGIFNITKLTIASTDSSFSSKEINISDLRETKNMNWSKSGEVTLSI